MSTEIRTMAAFGKRAIDEAWARGQRDKRELAICPWRFSAWLAGLVSSGFLLLLDAVKLLGGGSEGLGPIGEGAAWLSGGPGVLAGLMVLIPAALLVQSAWALLSLAFAGQPLILVDSAGIAVLDRGGTGTIMVWEEVARIAFLPGVVRLHRKLRAVPRLCSGPAYDRQSVRAPLLLVSGGAQALKEAIADIRPEMARRHFT